MPKPGLEVEVLDLDTSFTTVYSSIREAAKALNSDISTILKREKKGIKKPFRGRYVIIIKRY